MNQPDGTAPDVRQILRDRAIETHFQPITSIRRRAAVGVEALSRHRDGAGGLVPPLALFAAAEAQGVAAALDRLCRERAMEAFATLHAAQPGLILFVNCRPDLFHADVEGPDGWAETAARFAVDPRNVAIEVLETALGEVATTRDVVRRYKEQGFLVVLDDMGAGHANLARVAEVRPDILKADRSLVEGLRDDYHRQAVFRALVELSERIGGWIITEGVEREDQALAALELGADMLQGFYFARPWLADGGGVVHLQADRVRETAARFKQDKLKGVRVLQDRREDRSAVVRAMAARLDGASGTFDGRLADLVAGHPEVASACVLDDQGMQVSDTVLNMGEAQRQKTVIFQPPGPGTDHSLKEYYYLLVEAGIDPLETGPYVPLPSGELCVTGSTVFRDVRGALRILCVHLRADPREIGHRIASG